MSAVIIDGKKIAAAIKERAKTLLQPLLDKQMEPTLTVILVGDNPASQVYVRQKEKACLEVGLKSKIIRLPSDITQEELEAVINYENQNNHTVGILLQLPLPKHLNADQALRFIYRMKDVDGFTDRNIGMLWQNNPNGYLPCTPAGIMFALDEMGISLKGKHAVIVGRSNTVGKPLATMMLAKDATVTVCHSKTVNLSNMTKQADMLIIAVGKPNLINASMVKDGAVVIDVGINRIEIDGKTKLVGDVDFDSVKEVASFITPVPGGVGPLTVAHLMMNACQAAVSQKLLLGIHNQTKEDSRWREYS